MQSFMNQLISLICFFAGVPDPMHGSQYTFRLVQICTPEPCKLFLRADKKKRNIVVYATSQQILF